MNGIDDKTGQLTIDVKQEHIDRGVCGDHTRCAIAQELIDRGHRNVTVNFGYVRSCAGIWISDDQVCNFMSAFDKGEPVEPQTFVLEAERINDEA